MAEIPTRRPRVLIADDGEELREALVNMLEIHGYRVVAVAGSGPEATALADVAQPDLAIVDYRMPGLDGVRVTEHIKEHSPTTQVVLFSQFADLAFRTAAAEAGAFAYLVKGCPPSLLLDTLNRAWEERVTLHWANHQLVVLEPKE